MRRFLPVLPCMIVILSVIFAPRARARGGMEGGGGKSVVCRSPDGTIRTAEILDLYEGRTVYGLSYRESRQPWQEQAVDIFHASGVPTSQSVPRSGIYDWFENAIGHLTFLPNGTSLKPIDDSLEAIIPNLRSGFDFNRLRWIQSSSLATLLTSGSIRTRAGNG